MSKFLRVNYGYGLLASSITVSDTSITLVAGHTLPTVAGYFVLTLWNAVAYPNPVNDPNAEIVHASYSGTSNVYTILRAQESTIAATHAAGSKCGMLITAGLSEADLSIVGTKEVDETNIGTGRVLMYRSTSGKIEYVTLPGGGDMLKSIYDTDDDGIVDSSKSSEDLSITGQARGDVLFCDGTKWNISLS